MVDASIALREFNIIGIATHQFWVLYIKGKPVSELNGMATDPTTKKPKAIGANNDLLKVWEYNVSDHATNLDPYSILDCGLYKHGQEESIMLEGDYDIVKDIWNKALLAAHIINEQELKYDLFGGKQQDITTGNSNSVAKTLGEVMGFSVANISGLRIVPGQEKNLLPKSSNPGLYSDDVPQIEQQQQVIAQLSSSTELRPLKRPCRPAP